MTRPPRLAEVMTLRAEAETSLENYHAARRELFAYWCGRPLDGRR